MIKFVEKPVRIYKSGICTFNRALPRRAAWPCHSEWMHPAGRSSDVTEFGDDDKYQRRSTSTTASRAARGKPNDNINIIIVVVACCDNMGGGKYVIIKQYSLK